MKEIGHGAEAIIYLGKNVVKDRVRKSYRIKQIDERLRKSRTRREAKILNKLTQINFPGPHLHKSDDKNMIIEMDYIKGELLKNVLEKKDYKKLCEEVGEKVAILHNNDIMHGDLTTSNMILEKEIFFIDFGLSVISKKVEDMAVDLHLLKEALNSKHYRIAEDAFKHVLKGYKKKSNQYKEVLTRFETVEGRGRYKGKGD
ncbi:Kae1-associated serine/threonine protein kinase [Candidatus Woesearchaeota archaeon]|nr:Kae1-associated serine/threonine protein kinase [Candidatus Woesearchaeota archaeon]